MILSHMDVIALRSTVAELRGYLDTSPYFDENPVDYMAQEARLADLDTKLTVLDDYMDMSGAEGIDYVQAAAA